MATESGIEQDDYLQQLSLGGLTTASIALRNFIFQTCSISDFISRTIKTVTKNVYIQSVSDRVLLNPRYSTKFTWGEKLAARTVVHINHTNDLVRKEQIDFKTRQRKKE